MSPTATYRQRYPEGSAFYQCLEAYWGEFKESYPYFYEKEHGPWHSVVERSVERFLECGILRHGFARIHCPSCEHEFLLQDEIFLGHPVNGEVGTWLAPSGSQICSPFACPYSRLQ